MIRPKTFVTVAALALLACKGGPAKLDPAKDRCAACGMAVSKPEFAAQIVIPGESPLFFDDISCLAAYLDEPTHYSPKAVAYVADHRTGDWVLAAKATYTRATNVTTPMGSALIANADESSRSKDPDATSGTALTINEVFSRMPPGK